MGGLFDPDPVGKNSRKGAENSLAESGFFGLWLMAGRVNNVSGKWGGDAVSGPPPLPKSCFSSPIGIRTALCPGCPRTERLEHLFVNRFEKMIMIS